MLLYLTNYLAQFESGFNVFNYLTMRAILGALTALVISFVIGPRMIASLNRNQVGQPVRIDGPLTHLPKAGTPTMGGALILTAIVVSTILWADLENHFIWIVLFVTLAFGVDSETYDLQSDPRPKSAVLNADDPYFDYWKSNADDLQIVSFGIDSEATVSATKIASTDSGSTFRLQLPGEEIVVKLPLPGLHNVLNACAAAATAFALNNHLLARSQPY